MNRYWVQCRLLNGVIFRWMSSDQNRWVTVPLGSLSYLENRFERQIEKILDASGDVSVDVVVETMEVDSSGIQACLLDAGRHHVGQHIWLMPSSEVRRWAYKTMRRFRLVTYRKR